MAAVLYKFANPLQFIWILLLLVPRVAFTQDIALKTRQVFSTREAVQGVAVDKNYFYTINSRGIGKYDKKTGRLIAEWKDDSGRIIHLDGGVVLQDRIYCAHSNYPGIPMTSSIEIFSAEDLRHTGSHSFGIKYGSCTWADFYQGSWWVCFAHYDQFKDQTGKGTGWTVLVRFDRNWQEKESWMFPADLIEEFRPMSCSGGSWGPDGKLYVTGHDSAKVYILRLPGKGSILEYINSAVIESRGQGIAWDRTSTRDLYGIVRKNNSVIRSESDFAAPF